jgi:hypothetical protein
LKAWFSPGLIWASNSDQTDIDIKNEVIDALGVDIGLTRLCTFFKSGNVKGLLSDKGQALTLAKDRGFNSVHALLMDEIVSRDLPSEFLRTVL